MDAARRQKFGGQFGHGDVRLGLNAGDQKVAVRRQLAAAGRTPLDALPPAYDDVIWQGKVTQTYEWIFDHYGGGASAN